MKFVNYSIKAPQEEVFGVLSDSNSVVEAEKFDTSNGKPLMHVKKKEGRLKIKCEMTGRPTKDNGFLEGTYFIGRISEKNERTSVRGVILTAPIYHLFIFALFAYFIYRCISIGGISPVPIILVVFDVFMFWGEFKKQGIIKRYIFRSFKMVFAAGAKRTGKEKSETDS